MNSELILKIVYGVIIFLVCLIIVVAIWSVENQGKKDRINFMECVEATKCYKCVSISSGIGTAEYCGLEQNPFFQELDKSNVEWCYDKFIK